MSGQDIYAGGLPYELTEGDIICVFSQYGEIVQLTLSRDKDTGKSRGFCFLKYEDPRSCELAVDNFHGATIVGRKIKVSYANNPNALKSRKPVVVAPQEDSVLPIVESVVRDSHRPKERLLPLPSTDKRVENSEHDRRRTDSDYHRKSDRDSRERSHRSHSDRHGHRRKSPPRRDRDDDYDRHRHRSDKHHHRESDYKDDYREKHHHSSSHKRHRHDDLKKSHRDHDDSRHSRHESKKHKSDRH